MSLSMLVAAIVAAVGATWGIFIKVRGDGKSAARAEADAAALSAADKRRRDDAAVSAAGTDAARDWLRTNNRK
jgi:hypothetical protein